MASHARRCIQVRCARREVLEGKRPAAVDDERVAAQETVRSLRTHKRDNTPEVRWIADRGRSELFSKARWPPVGCGPGQARLSVTPEPIKSCAAVFTHAHKPARAVLDNAIPGSGCTTPQLAMQQMRP